MYAGECVEHDANFVIFYLMETDDAYMRQLIELSLDQVIAFLEKATGLDLNKCWFLGVLSLFQIYSKTSPVAKAIIWAGESC